MEEIMKRVLIVAGLGLAAAGAANAQSYRDHGAYDDAGYDWARVVRVDPIIETYDDPVRRDECWNEVVEYVEPRYAYRERSGDGTGGALLGAIIGGALGNQVGKGDGRRAATIAGAVIGGSIGHDRATRGGYREIGHTVRRGSERVCDERVDYQRREQVTGYEVAYEYLGRTWYTRTDAHPGDRIRVAVTVEPVF
jgi:uncharacterized protein YcfJ